MPIKRLTECMLPVTVVFACAGAASAAITDDLIRHYKLDEGSGSIAAFDATGSPDSDLTQNVNFVAPDTFPVPSLPTPGVTGQIGGAWDFERDTAFGVGQFLDEANAIWGGLVDVAASVWVKPESLNALGSNEYTIISEDSGTTGSESKDAVLSVTDQGAVIWRLELGEPTWSTVTSADGVITNTAWNHIAVVRENDTASIYVNGAFSASAVVPLLTIDSVNDLMLGAKEDASFDPVTNPQDSWDGLIDDAGFWERALSSAEVNAIYEAGLLGNDLSTVTVVSLTGDLDGSGFVGIDDLNIVLGAWNQSVPPGNALADPSGDGFVGIDDLNIVLGNWNAGIPPAASVPEPATLGLITLGGLALFCRRRVIPKSI
jgi:Concanavalin A-like lectin/glucanases superfamily/PEP-CTERM motif